MEGAAECGNKREELREHFEEVLERGIEVDPAVIGGVIEKVRDLSKCKKAREVNECMNGKLGREEIEKAMKEMKEFVCERIERGLLHLPYPVQYLPPGGIETGGGS